MWEGEGKEKDMNFILYISAEWEVFLSQWFDTHTFVWLAARGFSFVSRSYLHLDDGPKNELRQLITVR